MQFRELDLKIEGTDLALRVEQLNGELASRGLLFRPHFWLSDEWFTPDGIPGVAIPFYLAHPRLARLEMSQMLEVEGGDHDSCMRILRHEAGHAIDNAFHLRRRRQRRSCSAIIGCPIRNTTRRSRTRRTSCSTSTRGTRRAIRTKTSPRRSPLWLTPDAQWRQRYHDWPALRKLEYVDALMRQLAGRTPPVTTTETLDPLSSIKRTLRQHYRKKRRHYVVGYPSFYDRDLRRLFSDDPECGQNMTAAQFLIKIRKPVRKMVGSWTGIYQYTIDQVFQDMIERSRQLNLRLRGSEEQARLEFTVLLTVQTMNYLHDGGHRVAL